MPACCRMKVTLGQASARPRGVRHLRREHLQVKTPAVVGEPRDIAPDHGIGAEVRPRSEAVERIFVPVQLHAHAAHQRIARQPVELRAHVIDAEIGIGDDGVRPAVLVRGLLHPGRLVLEAVVGPVGLHVNRAGDAGALEIVEIFLDRIVAADRLVGPEDARLHRAGQPGQVGLTPDVMMGVDDVGHAALLCSKRQHMRDDRRARSAVNEIVDEAPDRDQRFGLRPEARRRCERRQPAHAPGAARQFCDRVAQGGGIAALQSVGDDDDGGAARVAAEPRHRQERLQRVADAGAAVPVADEMRGRIQRLLAALQPQRAGDSGEPRAEGEDLDIAAPPATAHARASCSPRCAPSSSRRRRSAAGSCAAACRRLRRPSRSTSPSLRTLSRKVRRRSANGPRRARLRRWPRRRGRRAGASRDSRRSASPVERLRKAALDQRFGARRGKAGFVGFVGQRRLVLAASFLLQADGLFVLAVRHARSPRCRGNGGRTAGHRSRAAPAAARASPSPAWRMCSRLRGPSNSMAARKAVVCSGATAKPLARSSATKETKTLRSTR